MEVRRSKRLVEKTLDKKRTIAKIFQYNIDLLNVGFGKIKLFHYAHICRLYVQYNDNFKYNNYNIRDEFKYDTSMRDFLVGVKHNKGKLDKEYIETHGVSRTEEKKFMVCMNNTINFIEKYLKKKQNILYKTILNEDVIRHILSFL